ncbi:MAG: hypothetical protein WCC39_04750, partial [Telluria sp.]
INKMDQMKRMRSVAGGCLLAGFLGLSGCGGGGGGGGSAGGPSATGGGTSNLPPGVSIAVDKSELRFVGLNGSALSAQPIVFSMSGVTASATYYAAAEPDANASFDTYITDTSLTSLKVSLAARSAQPSVDGSINFKLCADAACKTVVWSRALPYHIRNYTLDGSAISVAGYQGGTTSVMRTIAPAVAAGDLTAVVSANAGANWLSAQVATAGLAVNLNGAGMEQGTYGSAIEIRGPDGARLADIPVSVTVGSGFSLPASGAVDINATSPATIGGSIALAFNGNQSPAWSAASDKPWLVLGTGAGTGAAAVAYTIDTSRLGALPNFASDTAAVTFKAAGLRDAVYKVTVTKKLPEIVSLVPNPVKAGQAATLHLRGRGFLQLGSVTAIKANGVALGGGTIVSDTEALVDIGPMPAGSYQLSMPVTSAVAPSQPVLNVAGTAPLGSALIDSPFGKGALLYSAVRQALYTVDRNNGRLLRYRLAGGIWSVDKSAPIETGARIGLSHDDKTLYVVRPPRVIEERDPDSLAVNASYTAPIDDYASWYMADYRGLALPITSDGRIWFSRDQWSSLAYFDTLGKTFGIGGPGELGVNGTLYSPSYAVSADGTRMFANTQPLSGGSDDALRYDSATGTFDRAPNAPYFGNVGTVLSANGNYVLIGATTLYETATYRLIGKLPADTGSYYAPALLSPDGSLVYTTAWTYSGDQIASGRIDVVAAATMTKVGEIPLPQGVNCSGISAGCSFGVFTISPFGDTIFWAGSNKIAVIPVPKGLAQQAGVSFRLAR